jgi:hypothetical protein
MPGDERKMRAQLESRARINLIGSEADLAGYGFNYCENHQQCEEYQ